jgi:predicted CoA-binding protein
MVTKKIIEEFLGPRKLAIAGVSGNSKKFGYLVFRDLKANGYEVYPVNPK